MEYLPLHDTIALPGGTERLREAILFVADACQTAPRFGQTKLNKIIWRADFRSYAERGKPVTGRPYQRLEQGPCLVEMSPVQRKMVKDHIIKIERRDLGDGFQEERVVVRLKLPRTLLDDDDVGFLQESIQHYWDKTAREASDESHGVAWKSHADKDRLPYELALLSDEELSEAQARRLAILGQQRGWFTQ